MNDLELKSFLGDAGHEMPEDTRAAVRNSIEAALAGETVVAPGNVSSIASRRRPTLWIGLSVAAAIAIGAVSLAVVMRDGDAGVLTPAEPSAPTVTTPSESVPFSSPVASLPIDSVPAVIPSFPLLDDAPTQDTALSGSLPDDAPPQDTAISDSTPATQATPSTIQPEELAQIDLDVGTVFGLYASGNSHPETSTPEEISALISKTLGPPFDTGYFVAPSTVTPGEPDCYGGGTHRALIWGDLQFIFGPDGVLVEWQLGGDMVADSGLNLATPAPAWYESGVTTLEGLGIGSSTADLERLHPGYTSPDPGFFDVRTDGDSITAIGEYHGC